jgi:uncharacterized membrane protein
MAAAGMAYIGAQHFVQPDTFVVMIPSFLPSKLALVYISGVAEIAGGLGLLLPATRRAAAWGLILLYLAVFPANINMAINHIPFGDKPVPDWVLWARLPLQAVFIAVAYWFTREE